MRKNNCMDISNDKLSEFLTRKPEHDEKRETRKEKLILVYSSTKQYQCRLCEERGETDTKEVLDLVQFDGKGIVQEIKIGSSTKWYVHKPESVLEKENE